jgi:hypothetical protein
MNGLRFIPTCLVITAIAVLLLIIPTWTEYGKNISLPDRIQQKAFPTGLAYFSVMTVLCFRFLQEHLHQRKEPSSDEVKALPLSEGSRVADADLRTENDSWSVGKRSWWIVPVFVGLSNSIAIFATIELFIPENPFRDVPQFVKITYNVCSWMLLVGLTGRVARAVTTKREGVQYFVPPLELPGQLMARTILTALSFVLLLAGSVITFGFMWFVWTFVSLVLWAFSRSGVEVIVGKDDKIGVPSFTFCSGVYFVALGLQQHGWKWPKW